jgi:hypothetical protein
MKIDDSVAKANTVSIKLLKDAVKNAGLKPKDLASRFDVDEDTVRSWFDDTVPYSVFLQICKITHVKATAIFDGTKAELKAERAAAKADPSSAPAPAVKQDAAPAPAETVDKSVTVDDDPEELPFPLITAEDAGLKNADAMLAEWPTVKKEAIERRDDLTDAQKQNKIAKYPKPVKLANDKVELGFKTYKSMQGFVNGGYLNDINDVVAKRRYGVTVTVKDHE